MTAYISCRSGEVLGGRLTKTRNRTLLSNNHTKPRESHSQKATTQKTRSPATVRYGTAAAVVQLHRMQSTYAACARPRRTTKFQKRVPFPHPSGPEWEALTAPEATIGGHHAESVQANQIISAQLLKLNLNSKRAAGWTNYMKLLMQSVALSNTM